MITQAWPFFDNRETWQLASSSAVSSWLLPCSWAQPIRIAAAAGPSLLFDPATGEVLSQDRAGEPWYPASLTKLMTAYVVFQKLRAGTMKLDQKIPVSELAHAQPPSKIGVPVCRHGVDRFRPAGAAGLFGQ